MLDNIFYKKIEELLDIDSGIKRYVKEQKPEKMSFGAEGVGIG